MYTVHCPTPVTNGPHTHWTFYMGVGDLSTSTEVCTSSTLLAILWSHHLQPLGHIWAVRWHPCFFSTDPTPTPRACILQLAAALWLVTLVSRKLLSGHCLKTISRDVSKLHTEDRVFLCHFIHDSQFIGCKACVSISLQTVSPSPSPSGTKQRGQKCADSAVSDSLKPGVRPACWIKNGGPLCVTVTHFVRASWCWFLCGDSLNRTISSFNVCFKFPLKYGFQAWVPGVSFWNQATTRILDPLYLSAMFPRAFSVSTISCLCKSCLTLPSLSLNLWLVLICYYFPCSLSSGAKHFFPISNSWVLAPRSFGIFLICIVYNYLHVFSLLWKRHVAALISLFLVCFSRDAILLLIHRGYYRNHI